MIFKVLVGGMAALMHAGLVRCDDHVSCSWFPDAEVCTVTVDSPAGEEFSAFQLQLAICAGNIGPTGCVEELTGLCKDVSVMGVPALGLCLPALGPDSVSAQDATTLASIESCVGDPSPQCNDIRATFYETLGCQQCVTPANEAVTLEATCIAAKTKPDCDSAAKSEAATAPAGDVEPAASEPAPAPAPAPTPSPAVSAEAEEPAADATTDGGAAPDSGGVEVTPDSTSGAGTIVATGGIGLLWAAAAVLV